LGNRVIDSGLRVEDLEVTWQGVRVYGLRYMVKGLESRV